MKKMPQGPWPPARLAESELPGPQSPLSRCHVGRAQGCLLWDSSEAAVGVGGLCSPSRLWPGLPPTLWSLGLAGVLWEQEAQSLLPGLLPHLRPLALCGSPLGIRQKASWPGQFALGEWPSLGLRTIQTKGQLYSGQAWGHRPSSVERPDCVPRNCLPSLPLSLLPPRPDTPYPLLFSHRASHLLAIHVAWICLCVPSMSFPGGSDSKESTCNAGDLGSIPGSGRSSGGGNGNPLQYSGLENPTDRGAWWAAVHGVAQSQTRLSD